MAINVINAPVNPNTAFNPNRWVINSTNKGQIGFRYNVKLIDADTSTVIKEFDVAPRPVDGYGEFDLSKVLSDQLNVDTLNFTNLLGTPLFSQSNTFKFNYQLTFGEKYVTSWSYQDTEFISGSLTKLVELPSPSVPHPFTVGDSIIVTPNSPAIRPSLNGLYVIQGLEIGTNFPIINTPWVSTGLNPGTIRYADNRTTTYANLLTTATFTVFKSAINTFDWNTTYMGDYQLGDDTKKVFTNFKDKYYINKTQDLFFPIDYNGAVRVIYKRNDDVIFTKVVANRTSAKHVRYINFAPKQYFTSGVGNLFNDDIKYYDVWIEPISGTSISRVYRINVNQHCPTSDIELLFEDRMGGFSSFAFDAMYQYNVNVTKEQYNQPIKMNGSTYDRRNIQGVTNITIDFDTEYTLRTKYMKNREQDLYFEELLTSGNVFIKLNGEYQRCDILTTNAEFKPVIQNGLRMREIRVRLANKNLSNY